MSFTLAAKKETPFAVCLETKRALLHMIQGIKQILFHIGTEKSGEKQKEDEKGRGLR